MNLALILAQAGQNTQETDPGVDPWLLVGTIVGIVVAMAAIWLIIRTVTRRSRGGVEPPSHSQEAGSPPFEGVSRERDGDANAGRRRSLPPTGDRTRERDPAA